QKNSFLTKPLGKAILIGTVCILIYVINYYLRNMLSVFSPALLAHGGFTEEHLGLLSSTYMLFYAGGQLINGFLGDMISPPKMIFAGLAIAGVATALFPFLPYQWLQVICFAFLGFGLSMVRGPLMKTISENTEPRHARVICVFFSFASFAGPLIASLFAMFFNEKAAFILAGALAVIVVSVGTLVLVLLKKQQHIIYRPVETKSVSSLLSVFKIEKFSFYLIIACLVEIGAASISFWIPTYLTSYLQFDPNTANMIFSVISVCRAIMPFVALFIFNAIGERDILMMRISFSVVAILFFCMFFVKDAWANIALMILALMSMSCSSALLWSIYIPGLGKTGRTSSVNGVLDCSGYVAAALANLLFANLTGSVGWQTILLLWSGLGVLGVLATLLVRGKKKE
ncbi:MAG: MFS transporter, partial [Clostridia bacterium]|nr:MFS transporter [Clostridia bacterium]